MLEWGAVVMAAGAKLLVVVLVVAVKRNSLNIISFIRVCKKECFMIILCLCVCGSWKILKVEIRCALNDNLLLMNSGVRQVHSGVSQINIEWCILTTQRCR
jgi:hypothetical protein